LEDLAGKNAGLQQRELLLLREQMAILRSQAVNQEKEISWANAATERYRQESNRLRKDKIRYWFAIAALALVSLLLWLSTESNSTFLSL